MVWAVIDSTFRQESNFCCTILFQQKFNSNMASEISSRFQICSSSQPVHTLTGSRRCISTAKCLNSSWVHLLFCFQPFQLCVLHIRSVGWLLGWLGGLVGECYRKSNCSLPARPVNHPKQTNISFCSVKY